MIKVGKYKGVRTTDVVFVFSIYPYTYIFGDYREKYLPAFIKTQIFV